MKERGDVSLNLNLLNEKSSFEKLEESIKVSIFGILYVLLKNQDYSMWIEIIFVILQLLQFMAFPFRPMFSNVWKQPESYSQVSSFLQYFQLVVFFQDNPEMYIITFYISVCLVILVLINIIYVAVSFSNNRLNVLWPLKILRAVISFLVSILFLPIFELMISIFKCVDPSTVKTATTRALAEAVIPAEVLKVNAYATNVQCWSGSYYIHVVFAIGVSLIFILISFIIQLTYFETKATTHNQSAKSSSRSDVFMLTSKIICVLIFGFLSEESSHWILIIVTFFLSAFMFFSYLDERPYYNDTIMKVYLVSSGIFFWNAIVLLIGKILEFSSFDGSLAIFFLGIPIIVVIILSFYNNKLAVLLTNINKFQKGETALQQIKYFLELIEKKHHDRTAKLHLKGYIFLFEESCAQRECALKKYLCHLESNMDTVGFLYQHTETLYQNAISKFPNCTPLRISYAFFLLEKMNKKTQANLELLNTEKYNPRFEEQFIIFRYKKLIEEQSNDVSDNEENLDVVSNIAYKNHFNQFKNCIAKAATLYMDFWSLLMNPNQDNGDDLAKLNDYGSKINVLVEEINTNFEKMQKIKHNDQEVIRYYSDFLNDILNDKEKATQYKSRLNEIDGAKQNYDDLNLFNVDVNALASSDEYQYIIISAQPEKFLVITNVSLGICTMFGYTRPELIGKNVETIMPEIYHKSHRVVLQDKLNDHKKNIMNAQNLRNYKPNFREVTGFGKNKSRYLIPFTFKVTLVPNNEQNDTVFLAKISQDLFNIGNNQNQQVCYILTNNSFIIQNFTANALSILGMNSNAINNGNMEIVKFIKEFSEELIKNNIDEEKTPDQILAIKRKIINTKFKKPTPIIWRKSDDTNKLKGSQLNDFQSTFLDKATESKNFKADNKFLANLQGVNDVELLLTITEVSVGAKQEGYAFKFELINTEAENKTPLSPQQKTTEVQNINIGKELEKQLRDAADNTKKSMSQIKNNETPGLDNELDPHVKIDKFFIPESENYFLLDPKKMSYLINPKNINEVKDNIREEAIRKMKLENTERDSKDSNNESDDEDDSGEEGEEFEDEESQFNDKEIQKEKKKQNEEYYQIDFENFKFFQYDTKSNNIMEMKFVKESQIEYKKNEDNRKKNEESETKTEKTKSQNDINELGEEEEETKDNQGREGILIKQIEYALSKEESQPTIIRMKWISFFIFIIYVIIGVIFMVSFLGSVSTVQENLKLGYNLYNLIQNTIYGIFHTRELILLNNPKYTNLYQDRTEYIKNNTDIILTLFESSHDTLTDSITTFISFQEENLARLTDYTITATILQDDLSAKTFALSLSSAFIETNTAIYHIAHMAISEIFSASKDVFFYLYNSLNEIMKELYVHGDIYKSELGYSVDSYQLMFLYIFLAVIVASIISYILIIYAYMAVGRRKESYLEVFFEIGGNVIKHSLEKCEQFTKKIQSDTLEDLNSNLDESDIIEDTVVEPLSTSSKKSKSSKRKSNNSKEVWVVKVKIFMGLLIIIILFFMLYFMYKTYLEDVKIYLEIYQNICLEQAEYLTLLNILREYFFDKSLYVLGEPVNEIMDRKLDEIYLFKLEREKLITKYQSYFPADYSSLYTSVVNDNICPYSTDFFTKFTDNNLNCTNFVSNSSSYGLNILITNYVEEMRFGKYKHDINMQQLEKTDYIFNNTLYGSGFDKNFTNPPEASKFDPFRIFNDVSHRNLVILSRFLLRPAYSSLKTQMQNSIDNSISTFQTIYIVCFSVFFAGTVIIYIFVWRPFENGLNQTIYKTKNMLSIIPKEVLASLNNINKLLDIGQNFSKNQKRIVKT